jgi:D-threo-aldose 1-dehydrogenase
MKQIPLPNGRMTSQLGFGCAFSATTREQDALRLLDAAYDTGIRHFDVAPFYLDGAAELYLGKFLKRHKDATIATKYGLVPPSQRPFHVRLARSLFGPALRLIRASGPDSEEKSFYVGVTGKARFTRDDARCSFERSMRLLGTDTVDIYAMHSPTADDLKGEGLLDFLQFQVREGKIGAIGYAGSAADAEVLNSSFKPFCGVMQFDWTAFSPDYTFEDSFRIHFWVFTTRLQKLHDFFAHNPVICREWSEYTNVDLASLRELTSILLKASLENNRTGITLFTSSKPANIANNVRVAEDERLIESAVRFREIAKAQPLSVFDHG